MTITKYKPGDTVWLVLHRNTESRKGRAAKVLKVGRKWVSLDYGTLRFDAETGEVDGGGTYSSPGRVFASCEAHAAELAVQSAWSDLAYDLSRRAYRFCDGVTLEDITEARRLLGLVKP